MDTIIFAQPLKKTLRVIKLVNGNIPTRIIAPDAAILGDCGIPAFEEVKIYPMGKTKNSKSKANFAPGDFIGISRHYVGTNDLMLLSYVIVGQPDSEHIIVQQATIG